MFDIVGSMAPTPQPSSPGVSDRMRRTKTAGTGAEIALRSALHRRGLRFRVQRSIEGLPRIRPDIVFVSARVAVFVDGCFWHRCREHGTDPKANGGWWKAKLDRNVERDRRVDAHLAGLGWEVVRVWEHEDLEAAALRIEGRLHREEFDEARDQEHGRATSAEVGRVAVRQVRKADSSPLEPA